MTILTIANGSLPLSLRKGETLVIRNYSGVETVTGSTSTRELAPDGSVIFGPQLSSATVTVSSSGQLDYITVMGDPTPLSQAEQTIAPRALFSGQWTAVPSLSRLRVVGTGALSIDSRSRAGVVSTAAFSGSYSSTPETIEFPYYGDAAVEIRATFPATLTVEVI